MHRTLLKITLNPIFRRFGFSIVSMFDDDGRFVKYMLRPYPKHCRIKQDKMEIEIEFLNKLRTTFTELLKFGEHDGPCDNDEICEHCGSRTRGCSLHINQTNTRLNAVNEILEELDKKIGNQS